MAQQIINLGATGSGAGGDSARTAFEKAIANFAELYLQKANLASPEFTGNPKAPTPAADDNDTSIATTAFVRSAMALFGVGGAGPRAADLNSQMTSGLFTCDTSTLNRPASDSAGAASCLVSTHDADDVRQVYFFRDGRIATRAMAAGTWSGWRELFHTGNILGTVSQSAGVPTGAIIERGSNANGEYSRFADGTQICTGSVTLQPQAISTAQQIVVSLAAGFANTSYRVCSASETNPSGDQSGIGALNYNGVYLHKTQTAITFSSYAYREPLPAAVTLSFIAFGRWY